MQVLGKMIVVEQSMIKRKSNIIRLDKETKEQFDVQNRIIQFGPDCPNDSPLTIGCIPIISPFAQIYGGKTISKTDDKLVTHVIYDIDDMVGIDDEPVVEEVAQPPIVNKKKDLTK